jgi:hypothetical protein
MKLFIPKDYFDNPTPPEIYLCNTSKRILGQLPAYNCSGTFKWNTYSEVSFSVDRTYVDALTGETKVHPLFDKIESPRNIYVKDIGYFTLQDIETNYADKDSKTVTAFSLEYSTLGTKYLTNFKINKGDVDSKEVIYLASLYGDDYMLTKENQYTKATGVYDPFEAYYIKDYTDSNSWTWVQEEVRDADAYAEYDGSTVIKTLYVQKYPRVKFYHPTKPELSLVDLILESAPEWRIGYVDASLRNKERSFDETRVAIYDFLTGTVAETFGCIVEFDTLTGTVNFYEEVDDGMTEDNEVATRWRTDVTVSRDNLASEINVSYSSDNIKTKLVVSGADNLNISEVNFGRNEIMNLSFYHTLDWMEQDLFDAYNNYLGALKEAETGLDIYGLPSKRFPVAHSDAVQKWVAAQHKWNDTMHAVPAENDVVLVGDEFKKLHCMYTPVNTAFATETISEASPQSLDKLYYDKECKRAIIKTSLKNGDVFVVQGYEYKYNADTTYFEYERNIATTTALTALVNKLNLYHVDEDIDGKKNDNILLKLKNINSDTVTIRIYDPKQLVDQNDNAFNPSLAYYTRTKTTSGDTYKRTTISDVETYKKKKSSLYTNNYTIQSVVVRAETGIDEAASYWNMSDPSNSFTDWVKGNLTAEAMGLGNNPGTADAVETYTISYIGTMGAYFVLAENEFEMANGELVLSKDYLRRYGVNLLKEKHGVYTKIFQTQTEAMFSQDGYQCTAGEEPPQGNIPNNTVWLDSDSSPVGLYKYDAENYEMATSYVKGMTYYVTEGSSKVIASPQPTQATFDNRIYYVHWFSISEELSQIDKDSYANYQRYIDNYQRLRAVQEVLTEKEMLAEYGRDGYVVPNRPPIDISLYEPDEYGDLSYNGVLLVEELQKAAEYHFRGVTVITGKSYSTAKFGLDTTFPLYTFITSFDPITYGPNTKPYNSLEQYYVKSYYFRQNIADQAEFDEYDGSTDDKKLYVVKSLNPTVYEVNTSEYDKSAQYYIKMGDIFSYMPVEIKDEEIFNKYGLTDDTTLYVVTSGHIFAVYLKGTTPYVAYLDSMGVYQMMRDYIRNKTEMSNFFTEDQWIRLSPFIREDEFNDSNFFIIEGDSEEQKMQIMKDLVEAATKELNTLCQPSLEFSMTMANILALPEFAPLFNQFQLGNFVRVHIRDDYMKRARLLEVNINFDDLTDFSCTFGNLVTTKSEIDKHADLLAQAITAGKQVATAAGTWQRSADKVNKLEEAIEDGLQDAALQVGRASGQAITWDANGFYCRKFVDGSTTEYKDEQIAIINNKIVFTNDGWKTSKAALGEFQVDTNGDGEAETMYGLLADAVVSGYIKGSVIDGGSLRIGGTGGTFIVNEDGSVQILGPDGGEKYTDSRFRVSLEYSGSTVFSNFNDECIITCRVYNGSRDITQQVIESGGTFTWSRSVSGWTPVYVDGQPNVIKVKHTDIEGNSQIDCSVDFDETQFNV